MVKKKGSKSPGMARTANSSVSSYSPSVELELPRQLVSARSIYAARIKPLKVSTGRDTSRSSKSKKSKPKHKAKKADSNQISELAPLPVDSNSPIEQIPWSQVNEVESICDELSISDPLNSDDADSVGTEDSGKLQVKKEELNITQPCEAISSLDDEDPQSGKLQVEKVELNITKPGEAMSGLNEEDPQRVIYQTLDNFDYLLMDSTRALAFIPFHTCFYFKGRLSVVVLSGVVELLGSTIKPDSERAYPLYSPRGFSLHCIRSVGHSVHSSDAKKLYKRLKTSGLDCDEETLQAKMRGNALLLLSSLSCAMAEYIDRLFPVNILRREECTPPTWDEERMTAFSKLCQHLETSIILRGAVFSARFYQEPDEWSDYARELLDGEGDNKKPIRLMLCGGKGVGKSTFLRYMTNKLIERFGSVLVIDFDPGQSEFVPAGCVSAVLVTDPLLGPNFTHFQQPMHSYFLGSVDVTHCPDRYVRSCHQLLHDCRMMPQLTKVPVVINTMGYAFGLGIDLTLDLIRVSQPLQMIQILSRSSRRNFPVSMDHESVVELKRGWLTGSAAEGSFDTLPAYDFRELFSTAEISETSRVEWGFRPLELRNIGFASYLSRMSNGPQWSLTDATPYRISWQGLAICICHASAIPPNLTMVALNASLVALCMVDAEGVASVPRYRAAAGHYPTILRELPLAPFLGYGIVRGIDRARGYIYIISPEPVEVLARVNCLAMGDIQLPESVMLDAPSELRRQPGHQHREKLRVPYSTFGPSALQPACQPYRTYKPVLSAHDKA